MRRFNALASNPSQPRETYFTPSSVAHRFDIANFIATRRGVCNFLTVSRVPGALSKKFVRKLIENENGRTVSEDRQRKFFLEEFANVKTWPGSCRRKRAMCRRREKGRARN